MNGRRPSRSRLPLGDDGPARADCGTSPRKMRRGRVPGHCRRRILAFGATQGRRAAVRSSHCEPTVGATDIRRAACIGELAAGATDGLWAIPERPMAGATDGPRAAKGIDGWRDQHSPGRTDPGHAGPSRARPRQTAP